MPPTAPDATSDDGPAGTSPALHGARPGGAVDRPVRATRLSLLAFFLLFGLTTALWTSRLPAVRDRMDLSAGRLGALLVAGAVGALVTVLVTGGLVARLGSARVLVLGSWVLVAAGGLMVAGLATRSVPLLAAGLLVNGCTSALTNVPINTNAAAGERAMRRSVMSQFHAAFSVGAVVGAALGALCAALGVSVQVQLAVSTVAVAGLRLALVRTASALTRHDRVGGVGRVAAREVVHEPRGAHEHHGVVDVEIARPARRGVALRAALAAWREPRTVLIGLVCLAASLSEGSASTWLPIGVSDGFGRAESTGALVLATFTGSMTLVRVAGPYIIDRLGRTRTLVASGVVSAAGLLVFGFAPSFPLAWAGVVAWGLGAALANPVALTAAADDPTHAAVRVSVVTTFGSVAQLSAPPVLGLLVDSVGARHTLALIVVAMVVSVVASPAVRPLGAPLRAGRPATTQG